ncbi:MAG TPA: DUF6263 family protein [Verrucomicrobiae bacterium]|nr:DUF6263 family protein [Verrucomicrobiae bacterium]
MNTRCNAVLPGSWGINFFRRVRSTRQLAGLVVTILLGGLLSLHAEEPDSKYMRSYYAMEKGDALAQKGQTNEAKAKYLEAQKVLKDIKAISPTWNTKAVAYRLNYVTERLEALAKPPATADAGAGGTIAVGHGAQAPGVAVKLLSPGNEPRQALRLTTKAGDKQKAELTLQMAMGAGGGELMKIPAFKFALEVETKEVTPEGDINMEMLIEDVTLDEQSGAPQMVEAMKATIGSIKGMVIASTISNRGVTKQVDVRYPSGTDPAARQSMEQMKDSFMNAQVLLPEEAVGPDAKWEVTQKIKNQGMTIDQKVTQHLVAMAENVLTIETLIEQSAANQKVANPAMPQLKVDLTRLTGSSKGQMTVDLSKVLPTSAAIEGGGEMLMSTGSGAQAATMTMKTEMSLKIEGK